MNLHVQVLNLVHTNMIFNVTQITIVKQQMNSEPLFYFQQNKNSGQGRKYCCFHVQIIYRFHISNNNLTLRKK